MSSVTIDDVGAARRDRAHHRPLAGIAVAAAAEHDDEASGHERAQRREGLFQRVGLVRVVDEDRRAVLLADPLEAARRALERLERGEDRVRLASRARQSPAATSALETWKSPGSGSSARQTRVRACSNIDARREALAARGRQTQIGRRSPRP